MKNITVEIFPDKWSVTIMVGSNVSRREWELTPTGARQTVVTGDQFDPKTEAILEEALDGFAAYDSSLALKKIKE